MADPVIELPAPRCPRYETLDAWRGLACVLVVLFHATYHLHYAQPGPSADDPPHEHAVARLLQPLSYCWVGVPLFFVISGYCITAAADSARRRPHPAGRFFLRRFRRIYPPLWVFLALALGLHAVLTPIAAATGLPLALSERDPATVSAWSWVGAVTLTEEWRWHVVGPPRDYFLGNLWTLCYEEQFYLLFGLIVLLAPRRLFVVVAVVSAVVFLIVAGVVTPPFSTDGWFFGGPWLAFAAGIAVYYRRNYATPLLRKAIDIGLLAGAVWAGRSVTDWGTFAQSVPAQLLAAFAGAFLVGVLEPFDGRTAQWKWLAPLRWCGVRCYSLYLVHAPVVYLLSHMLAHLGCVGPIATLMVTIPVCVAASLAAGWAFHRSVEQRFLNSPTNADPQPTGARISSTSMAGLPSVKMTPSRP
jgi:peptidoglycan/LPS O-acetylase OafA/YrhL